MHTELGMVHSPSCRLVIAEYFTLHTTLVSDVRCVMEAKKISLAASRITMPPVSNGVTTNRIMLPAASWAALLVIDTLLPVGSTSAETKACTENGMLLLSGHGVGSELLVFRVKFVM